MGKIKALLRSVFRYRLISAFFIISQLVMFYAVFGVLSIYNKAYAKETDRLQSMYKNRIQLDVTVGNSQDMFNYISNGVEDGNMILGGKLSLSYAQISANTKCEVILKSNEELPYKMVSGRLPGSEPWDSGKRLIAVGRYKYKDAYEMDGKKYVTLENEEYEICGVIGSSTSDYYDYKMVLNIDCLGTNVLKEICRKDSYTIELSSNITILDTEDQQVFVPNVKKGEVYYLKLADQIKDEFVATICVKKDNVTPLQTNILYTQSGQDKNIYQEFKTDKRSSQSIYLKPSNYSNKNVTFYLQKKEKGVWKTITNRMIAVANDHKRVTFDTGLKKGEYRLVSNAATGQIYQIALQNQPVSNKYQTKKAKAQTIKKGKTVRNIYTTSEKAARWYKVKATKKQSIKISTNNNSGKLEVSIYKKGRKKVLKKLSFKGEQSKTYRVKKGTYYVKTAKSGAKMNGEYTIRCK